MMANRIESMTPQQWRDMRDYREHRRAAALSTDRIDEAAARSAVARLYSSAGLRPPKLMLVMQSPMQCLMARGLLNIGSQSIRGKLWDQLVGNLSEQLRDQLWGQLSEHLWEKLSGQLSGQLAGQLSGQLADQLWGQLRGQLREQLSEQLSDQLSGQLSGQLWGQLSGQLSGQLWGQLSDQLSDQLWEQLASKKLHQETWFCGGWDSFWLAFYDWGRRVGATYPPSINERLNAYEEYAATCGVAYLYNSVALISDRPEKISFDHLRRLHSDSGPALLWRDGYAIHAWHGQRVPAHYIEDMAAITPAQIRDEHNAEMRRVLIEIYAHVHGPGRIISDMGATLICEDTQFGRPRRLYSVGDMRFLHVINGSLEPDGSRRQFLLGSDPSAQTPSAAVAASYGRPEGKYREAVRT